MKVLYQSRLARLILPKRFVAITLGSSVYTPRASLSAATLRHEQAHADQWKRLGMARFAFLYLWYHVKYGYQQNPFEVEARWRSLQPARRRAVAEGRAAGVGPRSTD